MREVTLAKDTAWCAATRLAEASKLLSKAAEMLEAELDPNGRQFKRSLNMAEKCIADAKRDMRALWTIEEDN